MSYASTIRAQYALTEENIQVEVGYLRRDDIRCGKSRPEAELRAKAIKNLKQSRDDDLHLHRCLHRHLAQGGDI